MVHAPEDVAKELRNDARSTKHDDAIDWVTRVRLEELAVVSHWVVVVVVVVVVDAGCVEAVVVVVVVVW